MQLKTKLECAYPDRYLLVDKLYFISINTIFKLVYGVVTYSNGLLYLIGKCLPENVPAC